jgi:hypothetical protein
MTTGPITAAIRRMILPVIIMTENTMTMMNFMTDRPTGAMYAWPEDIFLITEDTTGAIIQVLMWQ